VGKLTPCEGRDRLVIETVGAGKPHVERPLLFTPPAIFRQPAFGFDGLPAEAFARIEVRMMGVRARSMPPVAGVL
jgi:hypothetical protein